MKALTSLKLWHASATSQIYQHKRLGTGHSCHALSARHPVPPHISRVSAQLYTTVKERQVEFKEQVLILCGNLMARSRHGYLHVC
jgi:hypothetical protein